MIYRGFAVGIFAVGLLSAQVGEFESHSDVGETPKAGSSSFESGAYRVTGGGANIWAKQDAFQFLWKKVSGDVTLTADVKFEGKGAVAHRKAVLMVRQTLDSGSPYADVALHGDGMTSLQYRTAAEAVTQEVRSEINGAVHLKIERHGDQFMIYTGDQLWPSGPVNVKMAGPVYVGLGVCSHDANILETAVFSNVKITEGPRTMLRSNIHVYDWKTKSDKVVLAVNQHFEAPNWSRDGKYLLVNSGGSLFRLPPAGGEPAKLDLGAVVGCNNDHGMTLDGKMLAISCRGPAGGSQVYLAGIDGSNPKLMTPKAPSYFHGFSVDGKWFAYAAQRDGNFDIYRMSTAGGEEERLTHDKGLDDGPDYSPDGEWLYFHSERRGNYDVWRMPLDGAGENDEKAEQITNDDLEDWFPHPSPDGKQMLVISFAKGTKGHPAQRNVEIRAFPMPSAQAHPKFSQPKTIVKLFGGQGTINVNSWSPDSKKFAYVSYEWVPEQKAH